MQDAPSGSYARYFRGTAFHQAIREVLYAKLTHVAQSFYPANCKLALEKPIVSVIHRAKAPRRMSQLNTYEKSGSEMGLAQSC
jgi:hypothetical protein